MDFDQTQKTNFHGTKGMTLVSDHYPIYYLITYEH